MAEMRGNTAETAPLIPRDTPNESRNTKAGPVLATEWAIIMTAVMLSAGGQMMDYSSLRIMEAILCYLKWEIVDPSKLQIGRSSIGPGAIGGVLEMYCKDDDIQRDLAGLRGAQQFLDGIPGLLLALPFGWAADKYGRRPLLILGLISFVLQVSWIQIVMWFWQSLNIRLVLCSSLFGLLGGSSAVFDSLLLVALSDITSPANRTSVFLRLGAANSIASLLVPPILGWLMGISPWLSSMIGVIMMACAVLLFYFFAPETASHLLAHRPAPASPILADAEVHSEGRVAAIMAHCRNGWGDARQALLSDYRLPVLAILFVAHQPIGAIGPLLVQYCSKRYRITTASATFAMTIMNGAKAIHCFIVLPMISRATLSYLGGNTIYKDASLARISFGLIGIGWAVISLTPDLPVFGSGMVIAGLGHGAYFLVRGLLSNLAPPHYVARVFSLVSILDTGGYTLGAPLLNFLYGFGMQPGLVDVVGLPFACIGAVGLLIMLILCLMPLRNKNRCNT